MMKVLYGGGVRRSQTAVSENRGVQTFALDYVKIQYYLTWKKNKIIGFLARNVPLLPGNEPRAAQGHVVGGLSSSPPPNHVSSHDPGLVRPPACASSGHSIVSASWLRLWYHPVER